MKNLFGEVVPDNSPTYIPSALPQPVTWYLVASWYSPDKRWKIWRREWFSREEAIRYAEEISNVRGHTYFCILEVRLPGIPT